MSGGQADGPPAAASSPLDGWRFGSRDRPTPERPHRLPLPEAAVVVVLIAWNIAANASPDRASLPIGIAGAGLLTLIARWSGLSWPYLGLGPGTMRSGIRIGAIAGGVIGIALFAVAAIPATREFLADDRFVGIGASEMLYETLVRIPMGTALAEEVAFRGVLLGMLLVWITPTRSGISSIRIRSESKMMLPVMMPMIVSGSLPY